MPPPLILATCAEISAGLARPGDPDLTAGLARIGREWLRFAALFQTTAPPEEQPRQAPRAAE